MFKKKSRKAKAQVEMQVIQDINGHKKNPFSVFISSKKKTKKNVGLLPNGEENLINR